MLKPAIKQAQGFSLLEIMISIVVAGVALLGLAATQLKSLQLATNSYHYTLALIQAQNVIEQTWVNLCALQHAPGNYWQSAAFVAAIQPQDSIFAFKNLPASFSTEMLIEITWHDARMTDQSANAVALNAQFPTMPASCYVAPAGT
ncbi:prepilin-type N-terminal cleavage/methylation domain-containing protein [Pseudoalteromonas fenneropenaei]|uniref:Prepilin-type N-terminal cleavage/methylation domain-containing protein n=1 Tax=Pseudoalteromonas fenneropenaei TaxID=1737459 RepID=A0ABV7CMI3_9GAMM